LNNELNQSFKTLEHRFKQLQNENNALKQSLKKGAVPTTPGRSDVNKCDLRIKIFRERIV